jgi:hypothetical protein
MPKDSGGLVNYTNSKIANYLFDETFLIIRISFPKFPKELPLGLSVEA